MEGNKRKQNGITLIALIITIIVMLILVGVIINVVLNGGLFTQAQTAASETQKEAEKEQLLSSVVGAIGTDAKVDFSKLDSNLPNDDWTGTDGTYTSPKGNVFTVDENGEIGTPKDRNPFTNYIENGNYYYIKGDSTSNNFHVAVFSNTTNKFTLYEIQYGVINTDSLEQHNFVILDKNNTPYSKEQLVEAAEVSSFDEIGDDVAFWELEDLSDLLNLFKENYTKVLIGSDWYTLDTSYTLPTT